MSIHISQGSTRYLPALIPPKKEIIDFTDYAELHESIEYFEKSLSRYYRALSLSFERLLKSLEKAEKFDGDHILQCHIFHNRLKA